MLATGKQIKFETIAVRVICLNAEIITAAVPIWTEIKTAIVPESFLCKNLENKSVRGLESKQIARTAENDN